MGLTTFGTLSAGEEVAHPRCFRHQEQALAQAHPRLSKEETGTPEHAKRRQVVARVHERVAGRRGDFTHQHRRRIVNACDLIAVEDWSVNRMRRTHGLATSIHDAAWSQFKALIAYQAAWAGRR